MNKEEILKAARNSKNKGKEYEVTQSVKSTLLGTVVAIIVGSALFLIELFVGNRFNVSLISVVAITAGTQWLYEGIKLKKVYLIILGIVHLIIAFLTFLVVVAEVISQ